MLRLLKYWGITLTLGVCSTSMPAAHEISIAETLAHLDADFQGTVEALAAGELTLWIGSGISRDRFDMLPKVILKVLEFLRARIDHDNSDCPHLKTLQKAILLAGYSQAETDGFDLSQSFEAKGQADRVTSGLSERYSEFLNLKVTGKPNNYLVQEGIDVVGTYADEAKHPDAEHYCIAALILEGVVSTVASANWDGLIENAFGELSGRENGLAVCVEAEHLQTAGARPKLLKFHGCALLAREDPDNALDLIIARSSQITNWGSSSRTQALANFLQGRVQQTRTLMLGLSAQDFNIQKLFDDAKNVLAWNWDAENPAFVFSEEQLGGNQDALLENMYPGIYDGDARDEIAAGSVVRAFSKVLLPALLLDVYTEKLLWLTYRANVADTEEFKMWARKSLRSLRDKIAQSAPVEPNQKCGYTKGLQNQVSALGRAVRFGPECSGSATVRHSGGFA